MATFTQPISGSTLVVLPNAGHLCNIEAPEAFNRAVRNFLRDAQSNTPASPTNHAPPHS
jgi:pimeloyl-ACP methyl ester carboxylesterase